MNNSIELNVLNKMNRNLDLNQDLDIDLVKTRDEFSNVVGNVINKGANYIIRGMPINNHLKDILIDVKDAFKTKDFKEILKTAVNSSIREGLEVLSLPKNVLKDIAQIKNIAVNGGLAEGLCAGIEIISKRYFGKNVYDLYIKDFFDKTKIFVKSKDFINKLDTGIKKVLGNIDNFKENCKKWYSAYDKFDLSLINEIADSLNKNKNKISFDTECLSQNNIIQNMTELINNKKDKLSSLQMQICNNI